MTRDAYKEYIDRRHAEEAARVKKAVASIAAHKPARKFDEGRFVWLAVWCSLVEAGLLALGGLIAYGPLGLMFPVFIGFLTLGMVFIPALLVAAVLYRVLRT